MHEGLCRTAECGVGRLVEVKVGRGRERGWWGGEGGGLSLWPTVWAAWWRPRWVGGCVRACVRAKGWRTHVRRAAWWPCAPHAGVWGGPPARVRGALPLCGMWGQGWAGAAGRGGGKPRRCRVRHVAHAARAFTHACTHACTCAQIIWVGRDQVKCRLAHTPIEAVIDRANLSSRPEVQQCHHLRDMGYARDQVRKGVNGCGRV
jgi:hypothetical protein